MMRRAQKNTFILFIRSISVHYRMCAVIWPFVHWHRYLQIALCTISVPIQCLFCSLSLFFWSCVCVFYICSCNCHVSTLRQYQQLSLSLSTVISICSSFAQIVLRKFNLSSKQIYIGFQLRMNRGHFLWCQRIVDNLRHTFTFIECCIQLAVRELFSAENDAVIPDFYRKYSRF